MNVGMLSQVDWMCFGWQRCDNKGGWLFYREVDFKGVRLFKANFFHIFRIDSTLWDLLGYVDFFPKLFLDLEM